MYNNCTINPVDCQGHERDFFNLDELNKYKILQEKNAVDLSNAFKLYSGNIDRAKVISECGSIVGVKDGHVASANFCHLRLCPMCAWRKSREQYIKLRQVVDYLKNDKYRFILATFTIKNNIELSLGIEQITSGFDNLRHWKSIKDISKGYIRSLEITYNKKTGEFHPHLHVLFCVSSDYFHKDNYKTQDWWRVQWESAADIPYKSQVDVRAVRADTERKAIAEIAKYMVKPSSVLKISDHSEKVAVLHTIMQDTHHRRLRTYGGCIRSALKDLKINIDNDDDMNIESGQAVEYYIWSRGAYIKCM